MILKLLVLTLKKIKANKQGKQYLYLIQTKRQLFSEIDYSANIVESSSWLQISA